MADTRYIGGGESGGYALVEMVGRGGFATVWRARPTNGGAKKGLFGRGAAEDVAVKVIPVYSVGERSRALREGQIAEGLRHANIVETIEVIPGDLEVYLVTEFVRGEPLDVAARHYSVYDVIDALAQILSALDHAHAQGIIHRDIKPQNALVDGRGRVKLTDFGVAYRAGDTRLTQVGYAVGTPGYIAPEILDGEDPSELTDIYAVGATARALLAHQPEEPTPRLLEFVNRATSPNPAHRPKSAHAALRLLTGRRESTGGRTRTTKNGMGRNLAEKGEKKMVPKQGYRGQALRLVNGLVAGWLGYLGAGLLLNGAGAVGVAAGFGVLCYLLPRLGALGVIVALAVALLRNGQAGLGVAALLPTVGGVWVATGSVDRSVGRLPLGPLLAIPLSAVPLAGLGVGLGAGLGAGLPLLFGGLMRPIGAALSAAMAAVTLVAYELVWGDGFIPLLGLAVGKVSAYASPTEIFRAGEWLASSYPALTLLAALWAVMAAVVAFAEWVGVWPVGLAAAAGGGALGYALAVSATREARVEAVVSLGFAAIMYGVVRYLASRASG